MRYKFMITFKQKGDFSKTTNFFQRIKEFSGTSDLDKYGKMGVEALANATPRDTGKTANSWDYIIEHKKGRSSIIWTNSNIKDGIPIAVILQYGHGTRWGTYVQGIDYINPAMVPVFDKIADMIWKEVAK